jgi:hypothetical protein
MRTIFHISLFLATSLSFGIKSNDDVPQKQPKQSQEETKAKNNNSTNNIAPKSDEKKPLTIQDLLKMTRGKRKEVLYKNFLEDNIPPKSKL